MENKWVDNQQVFADLSKKKHPNKTLKGNIFANQILPIMKKISCFKNKAFVGLGSCDNVQTERKI